MATLNTEGLDELMLSLEELAELPDSVADEMLTAQGLVVLEAQRAEAELLGMYEGDTTHGNARESGKGNSLPGQKKSHSTGELARSLKLGNMKRKDGAPVKYVYFSGERKRGKTTTKNSEIAFLNEYGTRTINARGFIRAANQKSLDRAGKAAAEVYDRWLKSKGL